jgi:hypothetical protein
MWFYTFHAQLTSLCHCSTNWLAGFNLNNPVSQREFFTFTNFGTHSTRPFSELFLILYKEFNVKLFYLLIILFYLKQILLEDKKG